MNILIVDHVCHKRTKSADFFCDLLRVKHQVKVFYYEKYYCCNPDEENITWADVIVFWEFLPSRFKIDINGKKCVFVPMYDNEWASYWQWKRIAWSGMGVISFCDKVTRHARKCGVTNLLDVRYFPDPADYPQRAGDPKRVFLWERGEISRAVAEKLFPPDAGHVFDVKGADEFLERKEYLERIAKCGIVIAPRRKEGIGMAFLEAMAMGKCVVAHNDATMNEYIRDGENGILFDVDHPMSVTEEKILAVLNNVGSSVSRLHLSWLDGMKDIIPFLEKQELSCSIMCDRSKCIASYPFFLVEGILYHMFKRFF